MALTAHPKITVTALPLATPGKTETATLTITNTGTATGRWIIRGALYDQAGRSIGGYVSKSLSLAPHASGRVSLTTVGPISKIYAGSYIGAVFTAASGSVNSASARTAEYRLHVAALTAPASSPPPVTPPQPTVQPPASSTSGGPPTIPWYTNLWDNHKPEVIGGGVAVVLVGGGLAVGHHMRRHPR